MVKRSLPHGADGEGERLRWKGQRAPRKAVFMKVGTGEGRSSMAYNEEGTAAQRSHVRAKGWGWMEESRLT